MTSLYLEVIASIVAAALLSLIIGWLIRGSSTKRRISALSDEWQSKTDDLKKKHTDEVEELESQLQAAAANIRQLTADNRELKARTGESNASADQARSDAIELNRKQAKLQDRLQRIIRQKDREIAALQQAVNQSQAAKPAPAVSTPTAPTTGEVEAYIDQHAHRVSRNTPRPAPKQRVAKRAPATQPKVAASRVDAVQAPADAEDALTSTHDEAFDATAILDVPVNLNDPATRAAATTPVQAPEHFDDTLDADASLDHTDIMTLDSTDEATIALDDDVLDKALSRPRSAK